MKTLEQVKEEMRIKDGTMNRKERRAKEKRTGNKIDVLNKPYTNPKCQRCNSELKQRLFMGIKVGEKKEIVCPNCDVKITVNGV